MLYEKTLKTSIVDQKIGEKEALEVKNNFILSLDKRNDNKRKTQFKKEEVFGDIINKDKLSQEQITKLNNFLAKIL